MRHTGRTRLVRRDGLACSHGVVVGWLADQGPLSLRAPILDHREHVMGTIAVHEFMAIDGVFEDPSWTFEFGFDPKMGETLAAVTGQAKAILLGAQDL